jgi:predicted ATPase
MFSKGIYYLGPLREYPQRYYPISGAIMEDVGFKGEKTIEVLATAEEGVVEKVQEWIKAFGMAESMKIKPLKEKGTLVEVRLKDSMLSMSINLYDTGFGVSQVLPIIAEGFYAPSDSLILIEQPEIHLHPGLQSKMGDLLIDIARSHKKLVIETHSEHVLLRIQRRITEGSLKSDDVAIYFFTSTCEGTKIERIHINDLGRFENWPPGFFEEDVEESFAITKAFLKRKKEMGEHQ